MNREVLLDTETTGGSYKAGHEIIEIGLIEAVDAVPTGRVYHKFFRPSRAIEIGAFTVHGLTEEALAGQGALKDHLWDILKFIGDARLVIHNAPFDLGFMNAALEANGLSPIARSRCVDTVPLSQKFTGGKGKLDDVVAHMGLVTPDRRVHTALLDTAILAGVYARIRGGQDVDIAGLAAKADFSVPRADITDPKVLSRFKSSYFRRLALMDKQHAASPDAVTSAAAAKEITRVLRSALGAAVDFPDLIRNIEAGGVRVRPHLNDVGELLGFRFRKDGYFTKSADLGMRTSDLQRGNKAFVAKDHKAFVREIQMAYDVDFGTTKMDDARQISPALFARDKVEISPAAVKSAPEDEARVRQLVDQINAQEPRLDVAFYKPLVIGRDQWSSASYDWIEKNAAKSLAGREIERAAFEEMAVASRMTAMRWLCRGLDPAHAVTMSVARDRHFGNQVARGLGDMAEKLCESRPAQHHSSPTPM